MVGQHSLVNIWGDPALTKTGQNLLAAVCHTLSVFSFPRHGLPYLRTQNRAGVHKNSSCSCVHSALPYIPFQLQSRFSGNDRVSPEELTGRVYDNTKCSLYCVRFEPFHFEVICLNYVQFESLYV